MNEKSKRGRAVEPRFERPASTKRPRLSASKRLQVLPVNEATLI